MKLFGSRRRNAAPRKSARYPAFGMVHLTGGGGWVENAYVKDLSSFGARIAVDDPKNVPDRISVEIPQEKIRVDARVKWRSQTAIGVEFSSPVPLSDKRESPLDSVRTG